MENLLKEILSEIKIMKNDINSIKTTQEEHSQSLKNIEIKLESVSNKLDDIEFLKYEEYLTKQDIFKLKKNLSIFNKANF